MTEKTDIRDSDEKVVEIEMERLRTFTNPLFFVSCEKICSYL